MCMLGICCVKSLVWDKTKTENLSSLGHFVIIIFQTLNFEISQLLSAQNYKVISKVGGEVKREIWSN